MTETRILEKETIMSPQSASSGQSAADCREIPKDVAERFGISGFRTQKFVNHDEDSSKIDRCSDDPAVDEAFEIFFNAK